MAKLAAKDRKKVKAAKAVSGSFEPLKPGKYFADLREVEPKVSGNGNAYWNIQFENIRNMGGEKQPGRQFYTLMLPIDEMPEDYEKGEEKWEQYQSLTEGRIKAFFEAFGYTVDSDTDEMIGDTAIIQVGIETIQRGARAGEKTNRVNAVLPLGDHEVPGEEEDDGDDF